MNFRSARCRAGGSGGRLGSGRSWGRREGRVEPAGVDPAVQTFRRLGINMALPHHASKSGLNMRAWAAEALVKVEVAESRIEIVPPQQAHYPAAQPDAFRVCGRARH